jgi:PDZ domain
MERGTVRFSVALLVLLTSLAAWQTAAVRASDAPMQRPAALARFHFGGNAAEIPARFVDYLVFLPAGVNQSQPSLFQLDTTAAASTIDSVRAAELGITASQSPVLNMSGVDVSLASLTEASKKEFGTQVGRAFEGALGTDFLDGTVVEINYARQTVRLYDPATYKYSGRGKSLHLTFIAGLPVVHARLSMAETKAAEGDFVLNTALDASVIVSQKFAQAHKMPSHVKTIHSVDFLPDSGAMLARAKEFEIGPFPVAEPIVVFSHGNSLADSDPRLAGEIGGGMLRRFILTLDYPHQQIYFDASSDIRADEVEDMSGIAISAGGPDLKRFEVTQVWPGTPGADAKIQKGDVIAGINDEAAADMSLAEIRRLFRQPAVKYKLLLQRGAQTVTANLQMRRQLGY